MMRGVGVSLFAIFVTGGALAAGCGDDDPSDLIPSKDAGADAGGTGGRGGTSGAGGNAGSSAGSGGSAGSDAGACAPPTDRSRAALCLDFAPEAMDFQAEEALDGRGILVAQIFDSPQLNTPDGGEKQPLAQAVFPSQPDGGTTPIETSVMMLSPLRFDDLPATVYVRTLFIDNLAIFASDELTWGAWVGGYDFSAGLVDSPPLQPISLAIGRGTSQTQPLKALRRLRVSLSLDTGVVPADDGQGPASVGAYRSANLDQATPIFGVATKACAAVSGSTSVVVEGLVVGSGDTYLLGAINDFNVQVGSGGVAPGSLLSVLLGDAGNVVLADKVTIAPKQYAVEAAVKLKQVLPEGPDAGGAYACPAGDGGI